jgi:hypothetical protein
LNYNYFINNKGGNMANSKKKTSGGVAKASAPATKPAPKKKSPKK